MARWWELYWVVIGVVAGAAIAAVIAFATYTSSNAPFALGRAGSIEFAAMIGAFFGGVLGGLAVRWRKVFRGDEHAPY